MANYIKYFPKPFLDDLIYGKCIPFIGAGFSKNAKTPTGYKIPLWDELGKLLLADLPQYNYTTAIDAASAYQHEFSRVKLVEILSQLFLIDRAEPGKAHLYFCRLPFNLVVTTNFDFLLEKCYDSMKYFCVPIIGEDQLSVEIKHARVELLKFHGDLNHPKQLIITEEDYDSFIFRNPLLSTFLANILISKTSLFIGYSIDDPDFRQIWQIVKDRLGNLRRPAYTIIVDATTHEISRFERRGVKVINIKGEKNNYNSILADIFLELKDYWSSNLIKMSMSSSDKFQAELILPDIVESRLCFFSVPHNLSAFYKQFVFPIAKEYGFTPIIAVDVLSPGDNYIAKISALIDKSKYIISDLSSSGTLFENAEIQNKIIKGSTVLTIIEEGSSLPSDMAGTPYLFRPNDLRRTKIDEFLNYINDWFNKLAQDNSNYFQSEPLRLLEKHEYRASIVAALSLLEIELKRAVLNIEKHHLINQHQIRRLIDLAIEYQVINMNDKKRLINYIGIRNNVVHRNAMSNSRQAKAVVNGIINIISKIRKN